MTQVVTPTDNGTRRALSEREKIAAEMLGRCVDRKEILAAIGTNRRSSISEWLQNPAFQEAVAESNRQYIAEMRSTQARIVAKAFDVVEAELANPQSKRRLDIAVSILERTLVPQA